MKDDSLTFLAAGNLGLEGVSKWVSDVQPAISMLVSLGQVAVATMTVIYIVYKIRKSKRANEKNS